MYGRSDRGLWVPNNAGYVSFGSGHRGNGKTGARYFLPSGKPTTQARAYLATIKPHLRTLVRDTARTIAQDRNRAYVTQAMCEEATKLINH